MVAGLLRPVPMTGEFLGNSHTGLHDVPGLVAQLLKGAGYEARFRHLPCDWIDSLQSEPFKPCPEHVVLQAQKISSSHRFTYSRDAAIALAKRAQLRGAKVWLYAEFPRKGVAESGYIEDVYRDIAHRGAGKIVPVGRAWDLAQQRGLKGPLWEEDGNHQSQRGSALTSLVFYYRLAGPEAAPPRLPARLGVDGPSAAIMRRAAQDAVRKELTRESSKLVATQEVRNSRPLMRSREF